MRALLRGTVERFPPGIRYMAGAALFFSLMSLLVKVAGQELPTLEVVLVRGVITLVLSWAMVRRAGLSPWGNSRGLLWLRGLLGFTALTCFYYAVVHLPLAEVTVIQYTNPVWTALLAAVLLDERLHPIEVAGTLLSLAGVVLVARPSFLFGAGASGLDPVAVGVALSGAVFSAGAYVTVRKLGGSDDPLVIVFYFSLVTTLAALPLAAPGWEWPTVGGWAALAGVGVTTQIAQVFMTEGLKRERAGRAMAVGYLQIVFAALWGLAFFAEVPDAWSVVGSLLVVVGTFVTGRTRETVPEG